MPILSICIPTYNRGGYLYFTLQSIVEQDIFKNTHDIEVVISDNCSSDLTEKIVNMFLEQYPDKIKYNRNETNIFDKNFEKVLSLGSGKVLKLHNDNFMFRQGYLEKIVSKIKELEDTKPMIFFANGNSRTGGDFLCKNVDDLIKSASYLLTWSASFSIWKEHFDKIEDFGKNAHKYLIQTDIVLRTIAEGTDVLVYNEPTFESPGVLKKGGYNIAKIMGHNYLEFVSSYIGENQLRKQTYEYEKKDLLLNHIIPMKYVSAIKQSGWEFKQDGYWRYLFKFYWYNPYFYMSIFKIICLTVESTISKIGKTIFDKNYYQKIWRKRNYHNETTISKRTDITKVFVGKNVIGHIDAAFTDNPNELLLIEDNVKIEEGTQFIFGESELQIIKDGNVISN